jgi:hypothetical protein
MMGPASVSQGRSKDALVHYYLNEGFNFTTFQMTMKFHHLGIDNSAQLRQLTQVSTKFRLHYKYQSASTPEIINGNLLLRNARVVLTALCLVAI